MSDTNIKNLLFDLGGVIMDIKRQLCVDSFTRLGMENADALLGDYIQAGVFLGVEDGSISAEEFRAECRRMIPHTVTDEEIDSAFCDFLIGIPLHRLKALDRLRKDYKIYMLSNTNPIMWNSKIRKCFTIDGKQREDYFDGMVTSFQAKVVKPNPKIYLECVSKFGIKPEETLFFDDGAANIKAAEELGFKTHLILPNEEFIDYFEKADK